MIMHSYMCDNCMEPYSFPETDKRSIFLCPVCKNRMSYVCSEDIDNQTGLVVKENGKLKRWVDEEREKQNSSLINTHPSTPTTQYTPKCPTCGSPNIRKIGSIERGASILTFGIFSKKINKTFKCQNCGMTF